MKFIATKMFGMSLVITVLQQHGTAIQETKYTQLQVLHSMNAVCQTKDIFHNKIELMILMIVWLCCQIVKMMVLVDLNLAHFQKVII